jgi:hypothetical protein
MNASKFWKQDSQPNKLFAVVASMQSMFSVFKDLLRIILAMKVLLEATKHQNQKKG